MLPGRLMSGCIALDHVAKVRVLPGNPMRHYRLAVRTDGSQPSYRGSIPLALSLTYVMFLVCNVD